jgi:hypothetical protein
MQCWEQHLLGADRVHFLADDLPDLQQGTLRQEEITVNARRQLADVARA